MTKVSVRTLLASTALGVVTLFAGLSTPATTQAAPGQIVTGDRLAEWSAHLWSTADSGQGDNALELLQSLPSEFDDPALVEFGRAIDQYRRNIESREQMRDERIAESEATLAEYPAETALSDALMSVVELYEFSINKAAVLDEPAVRRVLNDAEEAAKRHEEEGEWLDAHGLYNRLNILFEESGRYSDDLDRLNQRLLMLRLYVPKRLHEMQSAQRVEAGKDALPPYNGLADDWHEKLDGVTDFMVLESIYRANDFHVDGISAYDMTIGGLDALATMARTKDLAAAFPKLADEDAVEAFLAGIDESKQYINARRGRDVDANQSIQTIHTVIQTTMRINAETTQIATEAMLHEFGNGAMNRLDEYSSIIWPDELSRFNRSTQGRFTGVGIQISLNDALELQVVTPLSGTPAARAGIRAGDIIRKIDGFDTLGIMLSQAVDKITGPNGTPVTLSIEREGNEELIEVTLRRATIPIYASKGWDRSGPRETDWDYYIDPDAGIGYIRLTQFNETTSAELREAVRQMRTGGRDNLKGLILDLRYNPGGLLSEAVAVANFFIDSSGNVVTQEDGRGRVVERQRLRAGRAELPDVPLVVLVNGGSASASEIVAGALQDYDRAIVVGDRTFGKGSVQNVYTLRGGVAAFKLTTHFYKLPDGRLIHRSEDRDRSQWGIQPDVVVEMLPDQVGESLRLRQDADVIELDENGRPIADADRPNPQDLLTKGNDPQLETALLLLRSKVYGEQAASSHAAR
ncbi:MAG: S41 family peptidase [bacterium]|nr:S41 family peptidase [bacterium]